MNLFIKELTKDLNASAYMLCKSALAVPEDKHQWSPGGKARSVFDILVECAWFPQWIQYAVENRTIPSEALSETWKQNILKDNPTVESLGDFILKETKKLSAFAEQYPEAKLTEEMTFPWGTYTIAGALGFHYWNNSYHLGQINFIQLILGDTEMHM